MHNDVSVTRRSFLGRLSVLAGGLIVAGSASGVLTGCGGGDDGGGGGGPVTPPGTTVPTITPLPIIAGSSAANFANRFQALFPNVTVSPGSMLPGTVGNVAARLASVLTPDTLVIPTFGAAGPNGTPNTVTLRTARELGFDQNDLNSYIQTLVNQRVTRVTGTNGQTTTGNVILPTDTIRNVTYTIGGRTFTTPQVIRGNNQANQVVVFDSVSFAVPGGSELQQAPNNNASTNAFANSFRGRSIITNRNPIDGHIHYQFGLSANVNFDRNGAANLTGATLDPVILGPFVKAVSGPTTPTVSDTTDATRQPNPRKCREAASNGTFAYDNDNDPGTTNDESWRKNENNRLKVCNKTNTGAPGQSG